jgi:hypothetical protein
MLWLVNAASALTILYFVDFGFMGSAKVIPRIIGGLGNQIFCYAAARRLALANGAELAIDHLSGFVRDIDYQRTYQLDHFSIPCRKATASERLEPFPFIRRNLMRFRSRYRRFEERSYIQQEGVDFDPRLLAAKPRGTVYLEGYWQSEDYFKDIEATIRADLRIQPPADVENMEVASKMRNSLAVAVHVRFFDAPNEIGANDAPGEYYRRAVQRMEKLAPDAHYFVFSDHPDAAMSRIPLSAERVTVVSHNRGVETAYADLWLMSLCQHFIIANSTFSWWAAWLGEYPEKIVIAPGFEMRVGKMFWGFQGLLPEDWIKL